MTTHARGPRRGCSAYVALEQMIARGGKATYAQITPAMSVNFRSITSFEQLVIEPLILNSMARRLPSGEFEITDAGRAHVTVGESIKPNKPSGAGIVPPAVRPEFRPLQPGRFVSSPDTRPGALDYRQYPSLMGDERVPYRGKP